MQHDRKSTTMFMAVALACCSVFLLACAPSSASQPAAEHSATVEILIPAAEPTQPSAAQAATTAPPTLAQSSPTDTAVPPTDSPEPPTYTPRPAPTYTPRPVPAQAGEGERDQAILFQAETLDGTVIHLSDSYGTPTLLAFWAPW